jgi:DNA-binding PadR family transcriptional regulator
VSQGFDYRALDPLIHAPIRLAIMSVLATVDYAEFNALKDRTQATDGNLSVHLRKLEEGGYLVAEKRIVGRKPQTSYRITDAGHAAFRGYLQEMARMLAQAP